MFCEKGDFYFILFYSANKRFWSLTLMKYITYKYYVLDILFEFLYGIPYNLKIYKKLWTRVHIMTKFNDLKESIR